MDSQVSHRDPHGGNSLFVSSVCVQLEFGYRHAKNRALVDANETRTRVTIMTPRPVGHFLSECETEKIKHLQASTEMSIQEIATRMSCAKSTIVAINHKCNIRVYNGRRNNWELAVYAQVPETPNS
jgi:hypothetical protein